MKVEEIMTRNVASCRPEDRDARAAQLMWDNDCGILPVVDEAGRAVGMVSDRDLCMAAYTRGRSLAELTVSDAMSRAVFGCRSRDSVEEALEQMKEHRVRRLPVLDDDRQLVGLLSMNDVVRAVQHRGGRRERHAVTDAAVAALGAICEPRGGPKGELRPQPKAPSTAEGKELSSHWI